MNGQILSFRSVLSVRQLFVNLLMVVSFTTAMPSKISIFKDDMSSVEIIRNFGYPAEIHHVITEDGYVLELHRIPRSKTGRLPTRNYPVFFHHGVLSTSAEWVISGPNASLPMQLADDGYDVWLANCRGNTYSEKHVSLNIKQKAFWNFSFHEMGMYDLPAAIDYILMKTNRTQIHYIGYSMGSTAFFVMASERPEYQSKIRSQFSLSPVAYLKHLKTHIRYIVPYLKPFTDAYQILSNGMVYRRMKLRNVLASIVCRPSITQKLFCLKMIYLMAGYDPHLFNSNIIPLLALHYPAGTSIKTFMHFLQSLTKGTFAHYDYGPVKNMQYYNATKPPNYDLKSIQVPITILYGSNDKLNDMKDVLSLKAELPKIVDVILVNNTYCNHMDFLFSLKVTEHVNDPIKEILRKTDDPGWVYSKQSPQMIPKDPEEWLPSPLADSNVELVSNYHLKNSDVIKANTSPRLVIENNLVNVEKVGAENTNSSVRLHDLIRQVDRK